VAVFVTISIGIRVESVSSDGCLLYVEQLIAIHVGNGAHGVAAVKGLAVERRAFDAGCNSSGKVGQSGALS
jgi:hypothetical protein